MLKLTSKSQGVALKVKTDMVLQNDVRTTDVVFQYTTVRRYLPAVPRLD